MLLLVAPNVALHAGRQAAAAQVLAVVSLVVSAIVSRVKCIQSPVIAVVTKLRSLSSRAVIDLRIVVTAIRHNVQVAQATADRAGKLDGADFNTSW